MMDSYLVDTDVMIDVSRGNADAASYLDSLSKAAISIITAHELIVGARGKRDLAGIDSLISMYSVKHIDAAIGLLAYDLLKKYEIGWPPHLRFTDRGDRPGARPSARQPKPQALRDDRRIAG
jgi:hypothetical protein